MANALMAGKKTTKSKRQKPGRQLSRLDWLGAGEDILREKGFIHLKLAALTDRLHVSTGSFYHHFRDFDDYLAQLADQFDGTDVINAMNEAGKNGAGPITRLNNLVNISLESGLYSLDEAMRDWAVTDKRAMAALDRARSMTIQFYAKAFEDMGYRKADAMLRGRMLFAVKATFANKDDGRTARLLHRNALTVLTSNAKKSKLT